MTTSMRTPTPREAPKGRGNMVRTNGVHDFTLLSPWRWDLFWDVTRRCVVVQ
jgi:hypothetical protein